MSVWCLPSHPTPIYSLKYEFIPRLDIINLATVSSKNRRPTPTIRESSLKLGSSIHHTLQSANRKTNSRWRWAKEKDPDYVDSVIIEDDIPVESCSGDEDGNLKRPKRAIKRKRAPPSPPPLSPVIHDDISSREATPVFATRSKPGHGNMPHFQHTTKLPWHRPKQKYISGRGSVVSQEHSTQTSKARVKSTCA